MRSRLTSFVLSCALASGALLSVGASAQAVVGGPKQAAATTDERVAGLWYTDRLKFDELQSQGATGEGIKIAVIDAAINTDAAELQGANITVKGAYCAYPETGETVPAVTTDVDRASHGTEVVAMLVGNGKAADGGPSTRGIVPDAEVWFYSGGMPGEQSSKDTPGCELYDPETDEFYVDGTPLGDIDYWLGRADAFAAWHAIEDGADIIVYSAYGDDVYGWNQVGIAALRAGVPIVAGTPNPDGTVPQLGAVWPYGMNGTVAVSGVDADGNLLHGGDGKDAINMRGEARGSRNLGFLSAASGLVVPSNEAVWEPTIGYGTSLATPLVAGTIAIGMQMYPDASANQVLQAMIHTTGNSGLHEPEWHGQQLGYGIANPSALLGVDPTQYPDENPLFVTTVDDPRCIYDDGEVPANLENCAWSVGPFADEVWPAGQGGEDPVARVDPSPEEGSPLIMTVLIVGGVVLLGLIVAAVTVPIVVARSRKRKMQVPQPGPSISEDYRG